MTGSGFESLLRHRGLLPINQVLRASLVNGCRANFWEFARFLARQRDSLCRPEIARHYASSVADCGPQRFCGTTAVAPPRMGPRAVQTRDRPRSRDPAVATSSTGPPAQNETRPDG